MKAKAKATAKATTTRKNYFWTTDKHRFIARYIICRVGQPDLETPSRYRWSDPKIKEVIQELAKYFGKSVLAVQQQVDYMTTRQTSLTRNNLRLCAQVQTIAKEVGLIKKSIIDSMSAQVVVIRKKKI